MTMQEQPEKNPYEKLTKNVLTQEQTKNWNEKYKKPDIIRMKLNQSKYEQFKSNNQQYFTNRSVEGIFDGRDRIVGKRDRGFGEKPSKVTTTESYTGETGPIFERNFRGNGQRDGGAREKPSKVALKPIKG